MAVLGFNDGVIMQVMKACMTVYSTIRTIGFTITVLSGPVRECLGIFWVIYLA